MSRSLNSKRLPGVVFALAIMLALGATFAISAGTASAGKSDVVKDEGQVPLYGRSIPGDEVWTMVVFYRPVNCVPDDALFAAGDATGLVFVQAPGAFGCQPPTTSGQFQWIEGAGGPARVNLKGNGDVPVWFIATVDLANDPDNRITFAELQALPHLKGTASRFREITLTDVLGQSLLKVNASGQLEDGRTFDVSTVHHLYRDTPGTGPENAVIKIN